MQDRQHWLPYLPNLTTVKYHLGIDIPGAHFAEAVLQYRLARPWPQLASFTFQTLCLPAAAKSLATVIHCASNLTSLVLSEDHDGAAAWPPLLHELTSLRALSLQCPKPGATAAEQQQQQQLVRRLSALSKLTSFHFQPAHASTGATSEAVARALGALPVLKDLRLMAWRSDNTAADLAAWHSLTLSLVRLTQLSVLHLAEWYLAAESSDEVLTALSRVLPALPALRTLRVVLSVEAQRTYTGHVDTHAGAALVSAIATCTRIRTLELKRLAQVSVVDCCNHLTSCTRLESLHFDQLLVPSVPHALPQAPGVAPPPGLTADTCYAHLLVRLPQLRRVALDSLSMGDRAGITLFLAAVPDLAHLENLSLQGNSPSPAALMLLAQRVRQMPNVEGDPCES